MVDEMSFDSIDEQTDAVPNSEIMDSEDVDAMSFDAIDVEADSEPAMSSEAEAPELSTEDMSVETSEPPMDLGEPASEIELTSDQAMKEPSFEETGNEFALEANDQAEVDASQELSTGSLEINEGTPEEDNMLAVEPEEMLATELVTPITNPLDDAPQENFASLDDVQSDEMQASNEVPLDLTTDTNIEPQSPVEPSLEETNPLLQESHDLDDIDVAEFETDLASTDLTDIAESIPSLDPMASMDTNVELSQGAIETTTDDTISGETPPTEMDLSEMDFGDIEITDLESPEIGSEMSTPETGELEMDLSETNLAEATENPITSQDQINNLEEADIENLTEMQEQILLNE